MEKSDIASVCKKDDKQLLKNYCAMSAHSICEKVLEILL